MIRHKSGQITEPLCRAEGQGKFQVTGEKGENSNILTFSLRESVSVHINFIVHIFIGPPHTVNI